MICLGISKYLKVADCTLGMFAAFCDTLASLGYFFAEENWQLYLGWCLNEINYFNELFIFNDSES